VLINLSICFILFNTGSELTQKTDISGNGVISLQPFYNIGEASLSLYPIEELIDAGSLDMVEVAQVTSGCHFTHLSSMQPSTYTSSTSPRVSTMQIATQVEGLLPFYL
jgi:hypothetical protein